VLLTIHRHVTGAGLYLPDPNPSHGNPLHNIPRNPLPPPVIDLGGLGVGVAGQILHVLKRHVLREQVGDDQDAEAVRAEDRGQPGILQSSLEQAAHVIGRQGTVGLRLAVSQGRPEKRGAFGVGVYPGRLQILPEPAVQIVADGGLPLLAPLFPELQNPLGPLVLKVPPPQPGDGADPGPGVGQGSQKRAIAQAHDVGGVDRGEQVPGLLDGEATGLAV